MNYLQTTPQKDAERFFNVADASAGRCHWFMGYAFSDMDNERS